jgi:hypothetical protein
MTYDEATEVWQKAPDEVKTFVIAVLQEEAGRLRRSDAERTVETAIIQARLTQMMNSVPGDPGLTGAALGLATMTTDNTKSTLAGYLEVVALLLRPPASPPTGT